MPTAGLLRSQRGAALIIVLSVLFALSLLTLASVETSETELSIAGSTTRRTQALLAAEAGMARADFVFQSNPMVTSATTLLGACNADTLLPNAYFSVAMDSSLPRRRVICVGRAGDGSAGVQALYEHGIHRRNVWNHAVFCGSGADGRPVLGPLLAHGPVHILAGGEPFEDDNGNGVWDLGEAFADVNHDLQYDPPTSSDSVAWDLDGPSQLLNHSTGMSLKLAPRVPAGEITTFGGEMVATLFAELRVRHGRIRLSGVPDLGQANVSGGAPGIKETLDAIYTEDGVTGTLGGSVFSDNGTARKYDFDTPPEMPNLDAPYTDPDGVPHASYMDYLRAHALVIPGGLDVKYGQPMALQSSGFGSISVNSTGLVQGSGIIYVEGDIRVLDFGDIRYDGRFTLVSEGDVRIDDDVLSKDEFATNDVLGVVSRGSIIVGATLDQPEISAALFAQEKLRVESSDSFIAGAVVANQIDLNRPTHVYFVSSLAANMPPGMPGSLELARSWRRVPRSWVELD